jgi:hypothetical protein
MVYAKPPFGGPEQVLAYLGRYTHRVAIANSRLLSLADGKVRFTWKDYRASSKTKVMTLDANEFIRRFLLHTLPDSFHRIRHYGFLTNGARGDSLALCHRLLDARDTGAYSRDVTFTFHLHLKSGGPRFIFCAGPSSRGLGEIVERPHPPSALASYWLAWSAINPRGPGEIV